MRFDSRSDTTTLVRTKQPSSGLIFIQLTDYFADDLPGSSSESDSDSDSNFVYPGTSPTPSRPFASPPINSRGLSRRISSSLRTTSASTDHLLYGEQSSPDLSQLTASSTFVVPTHEAGLKVRRSNSAQPSPMMARECCVFVNGRMAE